MHRRGDARLCSTARPAIAQPAPSPKTTATGISPASHRSSRIRRHQLAELDHSYKLMRRGTHQDSILSNKAQGPAAPRIHCSRGAPGNPTNNELARRSGAILHAAGILQRLVRLGGKKESRNPPASAQQHRPPVLPLSPRAQEERCAKPLPLRRRSEQAAAHAQALMQHAPHLFPESRVAYRRRVPDGIAIRALAPAHKLAGAVAAAHAIARARAAAACFPLRMRCAACCLSNTASQVLQTPPPLNRSSLLVATCAQTDR